MIDWTKPAETVPECINRLRTLADELDISDTVLEASEIGERVREVGKDLREAAWTLDTAYPNAKR